MNDDNQNKFLLKLKGNYLSETRSLERTNEQTNDDNQNKFLLKLKGHYLSNKIFDVFMSMQAQNVAF